jgi:hypothetical protein
MKSSLMIQSTRIFSVAFLMAGLPLVAAPSTTRQADWGNLMNLAPREEIKVVVDGANSRRGTLQSVTDDAITVHFVTGDESFARQNVRQVLAKRRGHRGMHALIGMTVGAVAGLAIGIASDRSNSHQFINILPNGGKVAGTGAGAIVGAGVGALLPSGGWKRIYAAGD